jgi:hypothetical protein
MRLPASIATIHPPDRDVLGRQHDVARSAIGKSLEHLGDELGKRRIQIADQIDDHGVLH